MQMRASRTGDLQVFEHHSSLGQWRFAERVGEEHGFYACFDRRVGYLSALQSTSCELSKQSRSKPSFRSYRVAHAFRIASAAVTLSSPPG
jgi:hypothetical protein